jgi:hypothetical protein
MRSLTVVTITVITATTAITVIAKAKTSAQAKGPAMIGRAFLLACERVL